MTQPVKNRLSGLLLLTVTPNAATPMNCDRATNTSLSRLFVKS
ncbi:hypothetical protein [Microcoleus vaginatus]